MLHTNVACEGAAFHIGSLLTIELSYFTTSRPTMAFRLSPCASTLVFIPAFAMRLRSSFNS